MRQESLEVPHQQSVAIRFIERSQEPYEFPMQLEASCSAVGSVLQSLRPSDFGLPLVSPQLTAPAVRRQVACDLRDPRTQPQRMNGGMLERSPPYVLHEIVGVGAHESAGQALKERLVFEKLLCQSRVRGLHGCLDDSTPR